ncbi:MAG TPA: TMEM165/GDT1 family protein [Stellaceae bacterium]|nr:TMEM165/GDT1 family protein [Stellaceae bacterium]
MDAFLVSAAVVGLAEIGDKTQILSLLLSARFRRPLPIIAGVFVATLVNHAAAGIVGVLFGNLLAGDRLRWALAASFFGVALWALRPDRIGRPRAGGRSAFLTTVSAFFIAEIGDKTQIATIGLAARFDHLYAVVAGTTLGMMLANIPVVLLGDRVASRLPVRIIRIAAAIVFAALAVVTLVR